MSRRRGVPGIVFHAAALLARITERTIDTMIKQKIAWTRPAFTLTSTGFEVTMYLNTPAAAR